MSKLKVLEVIRKFNTKRKHEEGLVLKLAIKRFNQYSEYFMQHNNTQNTLRQTCHYLQNQVQKGVTCSISITRYSVITLENNIYFSPTWGVKIVNEISLLTQLSPEPSVTCRGIDTVMCKLWVSPGSRRDNLCSDNASTHTESLLSRLYYNVYVTIQGSNLIRYTHKKQLLVILSK